jgi:hypothetical protein
VIREGESAVDFAIDPYVGVGPIRFGMTRAEVRNVVGAVPQPFRRNRFERLDADAFLALHMFVYYKEPDVCDAVEFGGIAVPTFDREALLGRNFREVYEFLRAHDPTLQIHDTGLTSLQLGIGIYMSSLKEDADWDRETEGVIAFEPGYFDRT